MLFDDLFVGDDPCLTRITRPVGAPWLIERRIDVSVVSHLVHLPRSLVSDEDEVHLCRLESCERVRIRLRE